MPYAVHQGAHHVSVAFGDPRLNRQCGSTPCDEKADFFSLPTRVRQGYFRRHVGDV